jgi:plasmid stabilization system protein ParE
MQSLEFHPDVSVDIKESYNWYEEQSIGLGEELLDEIESSYQAIVDFPKAWAPFPYGFKRYLLSRFPYSIIYKIDGKVIYIISIMHNSREPNFWLERLKK